MASTLGFEPGPHWWEASALTTAPPLQRARLGRDASHEARARDSYAIFTLRQTGFEKKKNRLVLQSKAS